MSDITFTKIDESTTGPGTLTFTKIGPAQPGPGLASRFVHGLEDLPIGAAQLLSHNPLDLVLGKPKAVAAVPTLDKTMDRIVADREKQYEAARKAGGQSGVDWARLAGEVVNPLNFVIPGMGAPASLAGRLGLAALGGAGSAALQPVESGSFGKEKAKQIAAGAIGGPIAERAGATVAKLIAPKAREEAAELASRGVPLTLGQHLGGVVRRAESAARSVPGLGSLIKKREEQSIEGFNRAVYDEVLAPLGQKLPPKVQPGHDALKYAASEVGKQFDAIWPNVTFKPDPQYATEIGVLRKFVGELPKPEQQQFNKFVKNHVIDRFKSAAFDGKTLAQIDQELGHKAAQYRGSADPVQREMAQGFSDLQSIFRDGVERQNPNAAAALAAARKSYAMLVRVENAAGRRAGSSAQFSPLDLLTAIRGGSSRVRRRDFLHGDASLQKLGEAAQQVIPQTVPDSGTPERALWDALIMGGLGDYLFGPKVLSAAAAALPYTSAGQKVVQHYLAPSPTRQAARNAADAVARMLSGAGGTAAAQMQQP